jgi:hypothetical protein
VEFGFEHQTLGVHQQVALRVPRTFLLPSYPLCSPPTPVVLMLWESAMPALGSGSLPKRLRNSSRNAALSRSKVPTLCATSRTTSKRSPKAF